MKLFIILDCQIPIVINMRYNFLNLIILGDYLFSISISLNSVHLLQTNSNLEIYFLLRVHD